MAGAYLKAPCPMLASMGIPFRGIVTVAAWRNKGYARAGERGFGAFSRRAGRGKIDHPGGLQIS
jgi:hypothetical protein